VTLETPDQAGAFGQGPVGQPRRPAVRRAASGAAGQPPPGSIAELRARLERLPDGHPSSPYEDGGWLKPSPTRLRQLELGLPARSLGTPPNYAERHGIDPDGDANEGLPGPTPTDPRATAGSPRDELPSTAAVAPAPPAPPAADRPRAETSPADTVLADTVFADIGPPRSEADQAAAGDRVREETGQRTATPPATRSAASNGHHDSVDADGRLVLQHPYANAAEAGQGGNGSGPGEPALTRRPARDATGDRGSGPHDQRNGHYPAATPPSPSEAESAAPERERRRADPGRGDDSRQGEGAVAVRPRLAPDIRDLVDRIVAACRAAEGRTARGGYGTSGLTPAIRRIAAQLPTGGLAPGSEDDALKPADRFATRLARLIDRQPGRPPAELADTITDGIRYAFTFPAPGYTEGTLLVHRKLKAQGFDLEARRNLWDSREYKGVFTRWRDPAHGLAFEVQFHTTDSWTIVKQTHDAYLRITDPATPAADRARLRARQAAAAATVSPPPGCLDIADFRAEAR
jgi:hypothetical protein